VRTRVAGVPALCARRQYPEVGVTDVVSRRELPTVITCVTFTGWAVSVNEGYSTVTRPAHHSQGVTDAAAGGGVWRVCLANSASRAQRHPDGSGPRAGARFPLLCTGGTRSSLTVTAGGLSFPTARLRQGWVPLRWQRADERSTTFPAPSLAGLGPCGSPGKLLSLTPAPPRLARRGGRGGKRQICCHRKWSSRSVHFRGRDIKEALLTRWSAFASFNGCVTL